MSDLISRFTELPSYGIGAVLVLLLYAIQSEVRFGRRARAIQAGPADRNSTLALSVSAAVPVLGFALAMKVNSREAASWLPHWFRVAVMPGLPLVAWIGVALGVLGLGLRGAAVWTLRDRYTRTLLIQTEHAIERGGVYRWVRHPGYLGSLICLNRVALASGNWLTLLGSLFATGAAYRYRIRVEDEMLVASLGSAYSDYRRQVRPLLPFLPPRADSNRSQPDTR